MAYCIGSARATDSAIALRRKRQAVDGNKESQPAGLHRRGRSGAAPVMHTAKLKERTHFAILSDCSYPRRTESRAGSVETGIKSILLSVCAAMSVPEQQGL